MPTPKGAAASKRRVWDVSKGAKSSTVVKHSGHRHTDKKQQQRGKTSQNATPQKPHSSQRTVKPQKPSRYIRTQKHGKSQQKPNVKLPQQCPATAAKPQQPHSSQGHDKPLQPRPATATKPQQPRLAAVKPQQPHRSQNRAKPQQMRPAAGAKPCAASDADLPLQWAPMSDGGGGWDAVVIFDAQEGAPSVSKIKVDASCGGLQQWCWQTLDWRHAGVALNSCCLRLPLSTR